MLAGHLVPVDSCTRVPGFGQGVQVVTRALARVTTVEAVVHAVRAAVLAARACAALVEEALPLGHHRRVDDGLAAVLVHLCGDLGELADGVVAVFLEERHVAHDGVADVVERVFVVVDVDAVVLGALALLEHEASDALAHAEVAVDLLAIGEDALVVGVVEDLQLAGVGADAAAEGVRDVLVHDGVVVVLGKLSLADCRALAESGHGDIAGVVRRVDAAVAHAEPAVELRATARRHDGGSGADDARLAGGQMDTHGAHAAAVGHEQVCDYGLVHDLYPALVEQVIRLAAVERRAHGPRQDFSLGLGQPVLVTPDKRLAVVDGGHPGVELVAAQIAPSGERDGSVDEHPTVVAEATVIPPQHPSVPAHGGGPCMAERALLHHEDLLAAL